MNVHYCDAEQNLVSLFDGERPWLGHTWSVVWNLPYYAGNGRHGVPVSNKSDSVFQEKLAKHSRIDIRIPPWISLASDDHVLDISMRDNSDR